MLVASQAKLSELVALSDNEELQQAYNDFIDELTREVLGIKEIVEKNNKLMDKILKST